MPYPNLEKMEEEMRLSLGAKTESLSKQARAHQRQRCEHSEVERRAGHTSCVFEGEKVRNSRGE